MALESPVCRAHYAAQTDSLAPNGYELNYWPGLKLIGVQTGVAICIAGFQQVQMPSNVTENSSIVYKCSFLGSLAIGERFQPFVASPLLKL